MWLWIFRIKGDHHLLAQAALRFVRKLILFALLPTMVVLASPSLAESWRERMEAAGSEKDSKPAEPAPSPSQAAPGPTIPVVPPKVQKVTEYIQLTGNAESVNTVKLIARVQGYLEKIHFQDGQIVKKGDLLFTIQQEQYKAQLIQAKSQVKAQEAALFLANTEVKRYSALQKKGAAAQVVVDNWNFQAQKTAADLASAKAQLEIANSTSVIRKCELPSTARWGTISSIPAIPSAVAASRPFSP